MVMAKIMVSYDTLEFIEVFSDGILAQEVNAVLIPSVSKMAKQRT